MAHFYRDDTVEVSSTGIRVDGHLYRFDELGRVWHHRGQRSWREVAGRGAWTVTLAAPVVTALVGLLVAVRLDISAAPKVAIVLVALVIGLSAAAAMDLVLGKMDSSFDRGVRVHEIWADRRGHPVRLVQTRDATRFGRIYRAMQRAAEQRQP